MRNKSVYILYLLHSSWTGLLCNCSLYVKLFWEVVVQFTLK